MHTCDDEMTRKQSGRKFKNKNKPIDIAFNLDHPEGLQESTTDLDDREIDDNVDGSDVNQRLKNRAFVVASPKILAQPNWLSVSRVLSGKEAEWTLLKHLVTSPDDPKYTLYSERLRALKAIANYTYVVQVLGRKLSYEEVTAIFVRVNSAGAKLRGSDLALAQITSRWPGSLAIFEDFISAIEKGTGWALDTGLIVRSLVVFATGQSRFKTVNSIPIDKLKAAWKQTQIALELAINFLKANGGIEETSLLTSKSYLIPIAFFYDRSGGILDPNQAGQVLRWLFTASLTGWYSGSSETKLDSDLQSLAKDRSFADLANALDPAGTALHISEAYLVEKGVRSALFPLSYLACKFAGAIDWRTGSALSLSHQGSEGVIEFHHIFPKAGFKNSAHTKSEINEIANLAFLSSKANKQISSKPAISYLADIVAKRGEDALHRQAIPDDASKWATFPEFISERRRLLARLITKFLQHTVEKGFASHYDPG